MALKEMKIGEWGKISALEGPASLYRRRLMTLGILPGVRCRILRVAPLGDPFMLETEAGASFILRKGEAAIIKVEPLCSD